MFSALVQAAILAQGRYQTKHHRAYSGPSPWRGLLMGMFRAKGGRTHHAA